MIKPRSGGNPFLKVTFISDGEKREFTRHNKTLITGRYYKASPNKFKTRALTTIAAQSYGREAKSKVKKEVADYLREKKYQIPGNDIGTMS